MADLRAKILARLAKISLEDGDFEALVDLVDQDMDNATGGFDQYVSFNRFDQGPSAPGVPPG